MKLFKSRIVVWALFALVVSNVAAPASAQGQRPCTMSELLTTLKDPGLTSVRKGALVGQTYAGLVTVADVTKCAPDAPCKMEIIVEPGIVNPLLYKMVFATSDAARAERLKRGQTVYLTGKLARFLDFPPRLSTPEGVEWVMFDQVAISEK